MCVCECVLERKQAIEKEMHESEGARARESESERERATERATERARARKRASAGVCVPHPLIHTCLGIFFGSAFSLAA